MDIGLADLTVALANVRGRIARHLHEGIGEQDTKAAFISPVLRALGWDVEDLEDVKLEYRRRPMDNPVDYALFLLRTPRLFIEAKPLGAHLDDPKWAGQILNYAVQAGVEWVALTDGNEWRIYNSHATVPVEEKLFRIVRVAEPQSQAEQTLQLLAKAQMADHLIDVLWKSHFVDRQVHNTLGKLFGLEPDPALVRLIRARTPTLSPAEVRSSIGRLRVTFDFPVAEAPAALVQRPQPQPRPAAPSAPAEKVAGTPWRGVTLRQLVDAGLVRIPLVISHNYHGNRLVATIEDANRIVFEGSAYNSVSIAGAIARKSVVGSPPGRLYPHTNGWTFWQYETSDGRQRPLDELRRRLYERKVVRLSGERRTG